LYLLCACARKVRAVSRADTVLPLLLFVGNVAAGAVVLCALEADVSLLDGVYFAVIATTGVGLGDVVPRSLPGQLFVAVYVVWAMGATAGVASILKEALLRLVAPTPQPPKRA
jgi:hypothetical protein